MNNDLYEMTNRLLLKYGARAQFLKAVEELGELQRGIMQFMQYYHLNYDAEKSKSARENIIEEIADTEIMIFQIQEMLSISNSDINNIKIDKIQRTFKRLDDVK